jgi:hypothetical protein
LEALELPPEARQQLEAEKAKLGAAEAPEDRSQPRGGGGRRAVHRRSLRVGLSSGHTRSCGDGAGECYQCRFFDRGQEAEGRCEKRTRAQVFEPRNIAELIHIKCTVRPCRFPVTETSALRFSALLNEEKAKTSSTKSVASAIPSYKGFWFKRILGGFMPRGPS